MQFSDLSRRVRATLPEGESISSLGACAPLSPKGKAFPPGRFEAVRQEVFPFDRDNELKNKNVLALNKTRDKLKMVVCGRDVARRK